MKTLSIKAKITIVICSCLIVVLGTMSVLNTHLQSNAIEQIYANSSHELSWSLSQQVEQIMIQGENEKLEPLTEAIVSNGLLDELTIVDADRVVKRSSNKSLIDQKAQDELWQRLYTARKDTMLSAYQDGKPVQISYHVLENQKACADCHDAASQPVLGGMKMVQSTQALADVTASSYKYSVVLSVLGVLFLVAAFWVAQNKLIFKPLASVKTKLEQAAEGDIAQTLRIKTNDEIGNLLRSIQSLIDYIRGFSEVTQRIAEGDFTVQVAVKSDRDVLGASFKTMTHNLSGLIHQLSDNAQELVSASTEIASSSEQISKGSKDQSDQVNQISAAIEEMTATVFESSRNAGEAKTAALGAAETATAGSLIMNDTLRGMQKIASVVTGASDSIRKLATSTDRIGEIVGVINDIADQTNLLALNAAIEAARAGEQGRGFAVVADEVRKLAERTAKATGEVTEMIKGIQRETAEAVSGMEEGTVQVNRGRELADRAGNSLNEIVTMVQQVTDMITQIATASEEQASAGEQISKNIEHISSVTKETASGSEQSAVVAEELSRQAESLQQIVKRFKVNA